MDQHPTNSIQTPKTPITQEQFVRSYWFSSLQMVTVINPAWYKEDSGSEPISADYPFMVELRHFIIKAGKQENFPGIIANVYLDGMTKIMAQNDDKLEFMYDPALMKLYYDKLIVDVKNLAPEVDNTPAYLRDVDPRARVTPKDEKAPWDSSVGERASDVAPSVQQPSTDTTTIPDKPKAKEANKDKQFELEGVEYKLVVGKDGREMYYKAGTLCRASEFYKAASML